MLHYILGKIYQIGIWTFHLKFYGPAIRSHFLSDCLPFSSHLLAIHPFLLNWRFISTRRSAVPSAQLHCHQPHLGLAPRRVSGELRRRPSSDVPHGAARAARPGAQVQRDGGQGAARLRDLRHRVRRLLPGQLVRGQRQGSQWPGHPRDCDLQGRG